jgi:hypothetical protein
LTREQSGSIIDSRLHTSCLYEIEVPLVCTLVNLQRLLAWLQQQPPETTRAGIETNGGRHASSPFPPASERPSTVGLVSNGGSVVKISTTIGGSHNHQKPSHPSTAGVNLITMVDRWAVVVSSFMSFVTAGTWLVSWDLSSASLSSPAIYRGLTNQWKQSSCNVETLTMERFSG